MTPYTALLIALITSPPTGTPVVLAKNPAVMSVSIDDKISVAIDPVEMLTVTGEEHVLGDGQPKMWYGGTSPKLVLGPVDTGTRLPQALDPSSLVIRSKDGTIYEEGRDYILDHYWGGVGRIAEGRIKSDETVLFDYSVSLQRVDTVQISPEGVVSVKKGKPERVCPQVPEVDRGYKRLANIYLPFNCKSISQDQIFPIKDPKRTWRDYLKIEGREYLADTRALLAEGKKLRIVCYGDSVTAGASASSPDKSYPGLLRSELARIYPKNPPEVINAGIGGTNTDQRLPDMDKEVLAFDPDLVVVEFVNDINFPKEKLRNNYFQLIDRIRAKNPRAAIIILTPHFTRPDWMTNFHNGCDALREIAREKQVGLGDTANIWAGLRHLGIPYQTLLPNEINHPNDLGHSFFTETILAFLQ